MSTYSPWVVGYTVNVGDIACISLRVDTTNGNFTTRRRHTLSGSSLHPDTHHWLGKGRRILENVQDGGGTKPWVVPETQNTVNSGWKFHIVNVGDSCNTCELQRTKVVGFLWCEIQRVRSQGHIYKWKTCCR